MGRRQGAASADLVARVEAAGAFERYFEPFVGGGALFFELRRTGRIRGEAVLSDTNLNLVEVYVSVRDEVDALIERLEEHRVRHTEEHFYATRAAKPTARIDRAARVIYLNKTCFNGLYRENSKGQFNVPFGHYAKPAICDEENLRATSTALQGVEVLETPFDSVLERATAADFVYFDPPYDPVSKTSSFTAYAKGGFGEAEQRRLAALYAELTQRRVRALLSNSMTPLIRELYGAFGSTKWCSRRAPSTARAIGAGG